jgi:signal transduction histidine kinase
MVVREAVYNAVLHGHPRQITISVRYEAQRLLLTVADDGIGFHGDKAPAEGHYGITGMRERMEQIGGSFALNSAPHSGTRVILSLERAALLSKAANGRSWAMN